MALTDFDEVTWIKRLGVALEDVAAKARPLYSPQPPELMGILPIGLAESILHQGYRSLAARAKHDATAMKQFNESHLSVRADPAEARAIVREHALIQPWLVGSGSEEEIEVWILNRGYQADLTWLVNCLAKLSVKEGGEEAARRLHLFLTALADAAVPADEIIVFHGLIAKERVDLGRGAYFAPYEHARIEFDLPEEPEPFPKKRTPNAAVLVRSLACGPAVDATDDGPSLPNAEASYRFPSDYRIVLEDWFHEYKFLVDLLSIAARTRLLSRTRYVQFPAWIREIDPNLAHCHRTSDGYVSDVWPKGRELSQSDVDAFAAISRNWYTQAQPPDALKLPIRRLAASFSRPGGPFWQEDRILDIAIALEIFYDGKQGHELSKRAARLFGADAKEQIQAYDQARRFYRVRSRIVHTEKPAPARDSLYVELEAGQDLAYRSLSRLLEHRIPVDWAQVRPYLEVEAEAHVAQYRPRKACRSSRDT